MWWWRGGAGRCRRNVGFTEDEFSVGLLGDVGALHCFCRWFGCSAVLLRVLRGGMVSLIWFTWVVERGGMLWLDGIYGSGFKFPNHIHLIKIFLWFSNFVIIHCFIVYFTIFCQNLHLKSSVIISQFDPVGWRCSSGLCCRWSAQVSTVSYFHYHSKAMQKWNQWDGMH